MHKRSSKWILIFTSLFCFGIILSFYNMQRFEEKNSIKQGNYKIYRPDKTEELERVVEELLDRLDSCDENNDNQGSKNKLTEVLQKCKAGHLGKMRPICGSHDCLDILSTDDPVRKQPLIREDTKLKILNMSGSMDTIHINIVTHITGFHLLYRLYGSVGEIGTTVGKFAAVLGFMVVESIGERMFINVEHNQETVATKDQIASKEDLNLRNMFRRSKDDELSSEEGIVMFRHNSMVLNLSVFKHWNLYAFRLFSINGKHKRPYVYHNLLQATCALRPGGVVVVDGVFSTEFPQVTEAFRDFILIIGSDVLKPFLFVKNKLYLCTSDKHEDYMEHFSDFGALWLTKITDDKLGANFTYLVPSNNI